MQTITHTHVVYIGIGSNLGDKRRNCQHGLEQLTRGEHTRLVARSAFYKTEPVDYVHQDWFINMVAKITTSLDPGQLLRQLKTIESDAGRTSGTIRFGPRILDMDILIYDDLVVQQPDLTIPHPRMHQRRFVLRPLCDIDPHLIHPFLNKSIKDLLADLGTDTQQVIPCS